MKVKLDVFGKIMSAEYFAQNGWVVYLCGDEGKRRKLDIAIPDDIVEISDLVNYLDAIYHESATPLKHSIKVIDNE